MRVCCRGLRVSHKLRHTYSGVYKNDTPAGLKTPPTIERTNLLSLEILIYFYFDPEALRYVSWQQGTYLSGDVFAAPATIASDQISFVVTAPMPAESTQSILLTITFEVVATKTSMLSLNDAILVSGEG